MTDNINLVIILIYSLLYYTGFKTGGNALVIGAGIFILGTATTFSLLANDLFNITFSILLGIYAIYHGIFLIMSERKNNNVRR